jgi:hypothetical protein
MGLWELSQVDVLIEAYKLLVAMGLTLARVLMLASLGQDRFSPRPRERGGNGDICERCCAAFRHEHLALAAISFL